MGWPFSRFIIWKRNIFCILKENLNTKSSYILLFYFFLSNFNIGIPFKSKNLLLILKLTFWLGSSLANSNTERGQKST